MLLELISEAEGSTELALVFHVTHHLEQFRYLPSLHENVALDYIEFPQLDSRKHIQIIDNSFSVPENITGESYSTFTGSVYASRYRDVQITDRVGKDSRGAQVPLFWKHKLRAGTVEATIHSVTNQEESTVKDSYLVDDAVYTSFVSEFDVLTGRYRIYYVLSVDSNGTTYRELLNPEPAIHEATWEDVDEEGDLTGSSYTKEQTTGGFTYTLSGGGTYYVKNLSTNQFSIKSAAGVTALEPWYVRISNAEYYAYTNSSVRRYWLPEYNTQPFSPVKPFVYSTVGKLEYVNSHILRLSRGSFHVDRSQGMDLQIRVFNTEGGLVDTLSDEDIVSWSNSQGLVALGTELNLSYQYEATYFYKSEELTYTYYDFNPIYHPSSLRDTVVFYLIPNQTDRALHHLILSSSGTIKDSSQFSITDGVIGLTYQQFLERFAVDYPNDNAYYILGQANTYDPTVLEEALVIDVRNFTYSDGFSNYPDLQHSVYGFGELGKEVALNGSLVCRVPIDLLESYGGSLTEDQVRRYIEKAKPVGTALVIEWDYPKPILTVDRDLLVTWTWEGPYTYKLYRKPTRNSDWELLYEVEELTPADMSYQDDVTGSWYYQVRASNGVEYPGSRVVGVKV